MSDFPPVVGLVADLRLLSQHPFHCVGNKYVEAVGIGANSIPVILPALAERFNLEAALELVDGLLFTGSPSNVAPELYGATLSGGHLADYLDSARDATTLPLLRAAVARGIPVLGLCRGCQEINVAFGGTLHQEVHVVPGFNDHRENEDAPLEDQYAASHVVHFAPGGMLERLAKGGEARVNSLHGQGVDQLAPGMIVEAIAPDGLIEAFRIGSASTFALAVQWHPEWRFEGNPLSVAIFAEFGSACRERQARRTSDSRSPLSTRIDRARSTTTEHS
jgi:putative glutamine amidotransferase